MSGNKSGEIINFEFWNINRPLSVYVLIGVLLFLLHINHKPN